jgi:DNA-binding NarL/FixJ family response regulator
MTRQNRTRPGGNHARISVSQAGSPRTHMHDILNDAPSRERRPEIRADARGELVVAPVVARRIGERRREAMREFDLYELTPRELEVLELLARGWDNGQIASELYISRATVKRHISSILRKLDVDNRVQAAVRAVQEGILIGSS